MQQGLSLPSAGDFSITHASKLLSVSEPCCLIQSYIRCGHSLVASQVIRLANDIVSGLAYLHMRGVVHADLSANNILLCRVKPSAESTTASGGKVPGAGCAGNSKSAGAALKAQGIVAPRQGSQASHETSAGAGANTKLQGCGPDLAAAAAACATPSVNALNTTVAVTPPATRFMIAPSVPRAADDMDFTAKVCKQGPLTMF